jgi:hypothetical protein
LLCASRKEDPMTKLMSVAALFLAVGCGAPESTPADPAEGESEEALTVNGECYSIYRSCAEQCGTDQVCTCLCHNVYANCTTPKGKLYVCPAH